MAVEFPPRLPFPRRPRAQGTTDGPSPGRGAPASAVDRLGLRFLDPATALSEGGQTIRGATVYVGDCLLVGGDPAQLADTASVIEEITGLTVTVEESGLAGIAREAGLSDSVGLRPDRAAVGRSEG